MPQNYSSAQYSQFLDLYEESVQDIARIVVELNQKTGLTVVLVEQNIDMIRAMAQRCYVMDKGRVVAELTPAMLDDSAVVRRYLAV